MAAIRPQTLDSELWPKLLSALERGRLLREDDPSFVELSDGVRTLSEADPAAARKLSGYLHHLTGDLDGALACFPLSDNDLSSAIDRMCVLSNLGHQEDALEILNMVSAPERGRFSSVAGMTACIGGFQTIASQFDRARQMNLTNFDGVPIEELGAAATILAEVGVRDEEVAKALAVAGRTLIEYGCLFLGNVSFDAVNVEGEAPVVRVGFQLATPPSTATALYLEFLDRMGEQGVAMPARLVIAFEGVQL